MKNKKYKKKLMRALFWGVMLFVSSLLVLFVNEMFVLITVISCIALGIELDSMGKIKVERGKNKK